MSKEHVLSLLYQVMDTLLIPGAQISDINATRLLNCINDIPEDVIDKDSLNCILKLWFSQAVNVWEYNCPQPAVLTLALNFAVLLLSDEQNFIELHENNVIERFVKMLKMKLQITGATPYVRLMTCFLKHNFGCEWMISTNYWSEILCLTMHSEQNSSLYNEKITFISILLSKSLDINKQFSLKIISHLLLPTIEFSELTEKKNNVNEILFNQNCVQKLNLLEEIADSFLDKNRKKKDDRIFEIFKIISETSEKYKFEKHILDICIRSSNDNINLKLINLLSFLHNLHLIWQNKNTRILEYRDFSQHIKRIEFTRRKLQSHFQKLLPKLLFSTAKFYSKCEYLLPKMRLTNGTVIDMGDSLICVQLAPIINVTDYFNHKDTFESDDNDELRQNFSLERLKKIPPVAYYQLFQIRDYMEEEFSFDYSIMSVEYLIKSLNYYNRNQAKTVLISFIYCLEDFGRILIKNIDNLLTSLIAMKYLGSLIEAIKITINLFNLEWSDSFELVTIMEMILSVFSIPDLTSDIMVNGLELISVAFSKRLSIGLAFLMDHLDGDLIKNIIKYCTEKLDEENSEIRCSAIKVIESISNIVTKDFSSFQSLILKHNVPVKIFEFSIRDKDSNVRVSAIRCLQEMTKVEEFWNFIRQHYNIYEYICQIFSNDCYMVRSEVATLISIIYNQHDLPKEILMNFYDSMSIIIIEETSSTVRKMSLQFWKNVIQKELTIQGMIDGEFPEVTFSKEFKKIVVLNDNEIKKRLVKILHNLSKTGCLSALKTALDDRDVEVKKDVEVIVGDFYDILKRYNVQSNDFEISTNSSTDDFPHISETLKGRHILFPNLFLEFVVNYFNPVVMEISETNFAETILNEILNETSTVIGCL